MREAAKAGRPPGRIVNIISTAGLYGNFGQAAYAAAKAGLVGLTRVAAMDLARSQIHCNAVAPFAATRVTESIQPANEAQAAYKAACLERSRPATWRVWSPTSVRRRATSPDRSSACAGARCSCSRSRDRLPAW